MLERAFDGGASVILIPRSFSYLDDLWSAIELYNLWGIKATILLEFAEGPFLQWDAVGFTPPPQTKVLSATNQICHLRKRFVFTFLYGWNLRRRIRCCSATENLLVCYIYTREIFSYKQIFFNHEDHVQFLSAKYRPYTPSKKNV